MNGDREIHRAAHFAAAFLPNCFHFGNSSLFVEFSRLKDVFQVLIDRGHAHRKQLGQSPLRPPLIPSSPKGKRTFIPRFPSTLGRGARRMIALLLS
jgi:hypothetical protein